MCDFSEDIDDAIDRDISQIEEEISNYDGNEDDGWYTVDGGLYQKTTMYLNDLYRWKAERKGEVFIPKYRDPRYPYEITLEKKLMMEMYRELFLEDTPDRFEENSD